MEPELRDVDWSRDIETVRNLFRAYVAALNLDLTFQGFDDELATLPGKYAPPQGAAILAEVERQPAGVVALRPMDANVCEMKRLFVDNAFQGLGIGKMLTEAIIERAQALGYLAMRLDTLRPSMDRAVSLYRTLGFVEIAPYYHNPFPGATFLELKFARRQ